MTRIEARFADRAPRIIDVDGVDWWIVDGYEGVPALNPSRAGDRFDDAATRRKRVRFDQDVRPGAYQPDEWIADNEYDGVYGGVLFPSMSLVFYGIADSQLLSAVCRVYTDWAIEFASAYPNRLKAIAMINLDDVPAAVAELQRARNAGAAGGLIPVAPLEDHPYDSPEYEPFWAAAQDLDIPLHMHIATNRTPGEWKELFKPSVSLSRADDWVRVAIADLILSGVFERFPRLKVGSVEHEAGWAAFFLDRMDHQYTESLDFTSAYPRFQDQAVPSDFFHRNVFVSFCEDRVAIANRNLIGVSNLMWGNDYPHGESSFPRSREIIEDHLQDVPLDEIIQMTQSNAARLYEVDLPATEPPVVKAPTSPT